MLKIIFITITIINITISIIIIICSFRCDVSTIKKKPVCKHHLKRKTEEDASSTVIRGLKMNYLEVESKLNFTDVERPS